MTIEKQKLNTPLWIAQGLLAVFMLMAAYLKFQPIDQISTMMPWTGEVPETMVRVLGFIDLLGALGIVLPTLFNIKPNLTYVTALFIISLMIAAMVFHISRGESSVIGGNIMGLLFAIFIAWGRKQN